MMSNTDMKRRALALCLLAAATSPVVAQTSGFLMPSFGPTASWDHPIEESDLLPVAYAQEGETLPAPQKQPTLRDVINRAESAEAPPVGVPSPAIELVPPTRPTPSLPAGSSQYGEIVAPPVIVEGETQASPPPTPSSPRNLSVESADSPEPTAPLAAPRLNPSPSPATGSRQGTSVPLPTRNSASPSTLNPQAVSPSTTGPSTASPGKATSPVNGPTSSPVATSSEATTSTTVTTEVVTQSEMLAAGFDESERDFSLFEPLRKFGNGCLQAGLFVGYETTYLTVVGDSSQTVTLNDLLQGNSVSQEADAGLGLGFRTWAGLRSGNSGFRVAYWGFEEGYSSPSDAIGSLDNTLFATGYNLRAKTVDAELFQQFCLPGGYPGSRDSSLYTSLGVRYAELERSAHTFGRGTVGDADVGFADLAGEAYGATTLEGWGLTASIGGSHALRWHWLHARHAPGYFAPEGCSPIMHPWSFVWGIRGAVLEADTQASALTEARAISFGDPNFAQLSDFDADSWEGTVAMGHLQLGLEYRRHLRWCPSVLTVAAGFEGQYWETGDGNARSQSSVGSFPLPSNGSVVATAEANDGNLGLIGGFFRAGLSY